MTNVVTDDKIVHDQHAQPRSERIDVSDLRQGVPLPPQPRAWFVAAPVLMFGYGVVRLIDGRDGEYGPGWSWTIGHLLFLAGMLLFGGVFVRLRRLVPATTMAQKVTAYAAMVLGLAGIGAFVQVLVLDLVVGFRADNNAEMSEVRDDIGDILLPEAVWDLGPLLFQAGLIVLAVQLAALRPRRLAAWSPALIVIGFACIMVNLNLLSIGAALFGLALAPWAWRYAGNSLGRQ